MRYQMTYQDEMRQQLCVKYDKILETIMDDDGEYSWLDIWLRAKCFWVNPLHKYWNAFELIFDRGQGSETCFY